MLCRDFVSTLKCVTNTRHFLCGQGEAGKEVMMPAEHVNSAEQAISYTSLHANEAQYYVQAGAAQSLDRLS